MKSILVIMTLLMSFSVQANQKITLMLDWFVNPDHGPLIIAQQKGLFLKQGLDVRIQEPADPSLPPKLVAADQVNLAVSYQPQLIQDVALGLPLERVSTLIATPLNTLMVLDSSNIKSIADLKGKKIGTSMSDAVGEATIGRMLQQSGLSLKDVNIINVGWGLSSSLAAGKVDAVFGAYRNFEKHQLATEGYKARAFFVEEEGIPPYDELIVIAKKDALPGHIIQKFNRALELAIQYIVNHPQESWDLFKTYKADLDTELNQLAWQDTLRRFALRPAALDIQRYDDYAVFLKDAGLIDVIPNSSLYLY